MVTTLDLSWKDTVLLIGTNLSQRKQSLFRNTSITPDMHQNCHLFET